jgi:hypothetical protein
MNPELPETLLAIDLGLRCGFALYGRDGRLMQYRSTNFGSLGRLKGAVWGILKDAGPPTYLVMEGDRNLADIWTRSANKLGVEAIMVKPETWRRELLLPRQQRSGHDAKAAADELARSIIEACGASRPTSLRHDAAEAIVIGLWGVLHVGWLDQAPG